MFKTIFFISFICYSNSLPQNITKNENNYNLINDIEPVVGGDIATAHQAPWQVYQLPESRRLMSGNAGGGSIIHKRAVLTAAHCCEPFTTEDFRVLYGGHDRRKLKYTTKVTHKIMHPKWSNRTLDADICVLILADEVQFSEDIKLIEIADTKPQPGSVADVTGWGIVENYTTPIQMKHGRSAVIINKECQQSYKNYMNITDNMLCTKSNSSAVSSGDSGGALVVDNKLVGVVSFGTGSYKNYKNPDVFANAAAFKPWVLEQIQKYT